MRFDGGAADRIDDGIDVEAFAKSIERWKRHADLRPQGAEDEFLTKPFGDDVLLSAIRQAIERSRAALDHEAQMGALRDCYASLTGREREVMALVVSGLLNKQVGGEL